MQLDGETFKWFASLGVGGVLAWAMFYVYRKDAREWQTAVASQRDAMRLLAEMVLSIVKENSVTIATNTAATKQNTEMLVLMKGEVLDAFARAGYVDRRSHEGVDDVPAEHDRRHHR